MGKRSRLVWNRFFFGDDNGEHSRITVNGRRIGVNADYSILGARYLSEQRGEKSTELLLLSQMRFCIRGDSSNTTRRCKVVKDFESLQAKVKDLFEDDQETKKIFYIMERMSLEVKKN
jgi:hypothetical protein